MQMLHPFEVLPPYVDIRMFEGNGIYFILLHQGMWYALCPANIKFLFEESIRRAVEGKSGARNLIHSQSAIQVKAARTFQESIKTRATERVGLFRGGVEDVSFAGHI